MDCNILYRISDESYPKEKLPGATKERCLENFIRVFGDQFLLLADNCHKPLLEHLGTLRLKCFETNLGNSGSFRHALNLALQLPPESMVYFVEDDYLHLPAAPKLLTEAIQYADYVTVYDHPDKYGPYYDGGELSKVFRTQSSHWRFTSSTTMTFAAQVKTLQEDFMLWLDGTEGNQPNDHDIFTLLGQKGRTLAVSIPGVACHVDLTYSSVLGTNTIEDWATTTMIGTILEDMKDNGSLWAEVNFILRQMAEQGMTRLQQIACLAQIEKNKKASKS